MEKLYRTTTTWLHYYYAMIALFVWVFEREMASIVDDNGLQWSK